MSYDDVEKFKPFIVARVDRPQSYENEGYIAAVKDKVAAISYFSHCSCNDTWENLDVLNITSWDWSGTPDDLVRMALRRADPDMPDRVSDSKDFKYNLLNKMYEIVIKWDEAKRPIPFSESDLSI